MKPLLTVTEVATLSVSFCFKRIKTRVTEYPNSYIYAFTMGLRLKNVKKLARKWFSGSINDRFVLKALSTVAEVECLSVSFRLKRRKTRVTEHLNSDIYVYIGLGA